MKEGGVASSTSFPSFQTSSIDELMVVPEVDLRKHWADQTEEEEMDLESKEVNVSAPLVSIEWDLVPSKSLALVPVETLMASQKTKLWEKLSMEKTLCKITAQKEARGSKLVTRATSYNSQ